jgi:predicted ester cyclase
MAKQENVAVARRFIEDFWNGQKLEVADELMAPNATTPAMPGLPPGPEGAKVVGNMIFSAFPDFHMDIDKVVANDDKVAVRSIQTGTHQGEFMGVAPSGKKATWTEITIVRVENGKIVESWWETDMMTLMQQIGALGGGGE